MRGVEANRERCPIGMGRARRRHQRVWVDGECEVHHVRGTNIEAMREKGSRVRTECEEVERQGSSTCLACLHGTIRNRTRAFALHMKEDLWNYSVSCARVPQSKVTCRSIFVVHILTDDQLWRIMKRVANLANVRRHVFATQCLGGGTIPRDPREQAPKHEVMDRYL
ncbi:hypothetical protein OG21DRAFT_664052 [Imleria badia]|nr:hypothetical protein OG21DRAFT_664052 [Imleria badia]